MVLDLRSSLSGKIIKKPVPQKFLSGRQAGIHRVEIKAFVYQPNKAHKKSLAHSSQAFSYA
jgi:hypothetical protein